jgi:hypothetical protein
MRTDGVAGRNERYLLPWVRIEINSGHFWVPYNKGTQHFYVMLLNVTMTKMLKKIPPDLVGNTHLLSENDHGPL